MAEDQEKKDEEKFEFTAEGEALGYISLDQAQVLAMRTAREAPGVYGTTYRDIPMAFEVVENADTEDHYVITLSFRPQGQFTGTPGKEQFFIEKEGAVAHRQVLSVPLPTRERRFPVVPIVIGLVLVGAVTVAGVVFAGNGSGGQGSDEIQAAVVSPTGAPVPTAATSPTVIPAARVASTSTDTPTPSQPSAARVVSGATVALVTPTPAFTPAASLTPLTAPIPTAAPAESLRKFVVPVASPTGIPNPAPALSPTLGSPLLPLKVVVEPSQVKLDSRTTQRFTVEVLDASGNPVASPSIAWQSAPGVGAVDENGVFTAGRTAGSFPSGLQVNVLSGTERVSATVDVTIEPDSLVSVELSPSPAVVQKGETIQLAAQGFDLFKNPIEGLSFVWGAEGLAIDQTGKVTAGNQQGRYQVTASASYKGGRRTASVTVAVPPTWVSVGNMRARRSSHTATLLANGQVLVVGGGGGGAELYDPDGRTFSFTGSPICSHGTQLTSTVLADGNILITGGSNAPRCAEIYNADTGNFSRVGELNAEHRRHSATLLSDGRVLIAGGDKFEVGGDVSQDIAEIFDPATETFTLTGSLNVHRNSHAATLLPSGQVLITSGRSGKFPKGEVQHECLGDPELYDPISGTFSLMGGPKLRSNCTGRSMVLNSGIVLLPSDGGSANLFDPANQTFRFTGIVRANRGEYTNTLLSSGQVLITGGWQRIDSDLPPFATAEVYNPATRTFAFIDSMIGPRRDHAAVLLPDGSVLVTGGRDGDGSLRTAEIWIPGKAR